MGPTSRPTNVDLGIATFLIGGVVGFIVGASVDLWIPALLGAILIVLGGQMVNARRTTRAIQEVHGPSRVMFDRGKEMGYQQGWHDCRQQAAVVPMRRRREDDDDEVVAGIDFLRS